MNFEVLRLVQSEHIHNIFVDFIVVQNLGFALSFCISPDLEQLLAAERNENYGVWQKLHQQNFFSVDCKAHEDLLRLSHVDEHDRSFGETESKEFLERCAVAERSEQSHHVKFVIENLLIDAADVSTTSLHDFHACHSLGESSLPFRVVNFARLLKFFEQSCFLEHPINAECAIREQNNQTLQSARVDDLLNDLGRRRRVKRGLLASPLDGLCEG